MAVYISTNYIFVKALRRLNSPQRCCPSATEETLGARLIELRESYRQCHTEFTTVAGGGLCIRRGR